MQLENSDKMDKSLEGIRRRGGEGVPTGEGGAPRRPGADERELTRILKKFAPKKEKKDEKPAPLAEPAAPPLSPKEEILITEVVDLAKRVPRAPGRLSLLRFPQPRSSRVLLLGIAAGILVVLLLAVFASTAWSRLTVTVKPRTEELVLRDIAVTFDASLSQIERAKRLVPAERLEFTRRIQEEFAATGRAEIREKARGAIQIFNRYSSSPQTLVATTRFLTKDGVLYRLPRSVRVPGAKIEGGKIVPQFVETEVVADQPGTGANISGEVMLTIPGFQGTPRYEGFSAIAPSGFAGGFTGEAEVVSREDLERSQELLTKRVFDEFREEIARKIPSGFVLAEGLREIRITSVEAPPERSRHVRFPVSVEGRAQVLIFREGDLLSLLRELLLTGEAPQEFAGGLSGVSYRIERIELEKGRATVALEGSMRAKAVIPDAELRRLLAGSREASVVDVLKGRSDLTSFRLSFFPPWRSKAPADPGKIRVIVEEP